MNHRYTLPDDFNPTAGDWARAIIGGLLGIVALYLFYHLFYGLAVR